MRRSLWLLCLILLSGLALAQDGIQQFSDLGSCKLESGQSISTCRIGYRTYGTMNADKSNVVMVATWFLGNSHQVGSTYVGKDKIVDSSKYFVVVVDALGDGISSSPSNSSDQPRMRFPQFTIRDMVTTQHRLLAETFHLSHIHAVFGGSMGGMQALQWAYSYPDFMDRIVAIVPSPRLSSYDLLLWRSELNAIQDSVEWRGGDYTGRPLMKTVVDIHKLHLETPQKIVREVPANDYPGFAEKDEQEFRFDPNDEIRQLQAMMTQDVAPGKSIDEMAKMLKPRTMIVVALQDMMANPTTAIQLAKAAHLPLIELTGDCGHLAPGCESEKVDPAVKKFLAE